MSAVYLLYYRKDFLETWVKCSLGQTECASTQILAMSDTDHGLTDGHRFDGNMS